MPQPWDIAGSYNSAALGQQQVQAGDVAAQGQAAAGRALQLMMSPVPGAQPMQGGAPPGMPPGGQPPQQPGGILSRLQQPQQNPGAGAAPPAPMQQPPPRPIFQQGQPPQQAPVPGAQPMQPPQQPQMPPQGAPQQQPGGGPPQGQLDWRGVVQQVIRANPGVKDPRVLMAAVSQFLPIMTQQAQMEWKQVMMANQTARTGIAGERAETARDQGDQRIGIAQEQADTAKGRAETSKGQGEERIGLAKQREERLTGSQAVRQDQGWQRLELQKKALQQRITELGDRRLLGQWRATVDAQHKRATEIIQSGSTGGQPLDPAERTKLLKEEDDFYKDQITAMKGTMGGQTPTGGTPLPDGQKTQEQAPAGVTPKFTGQPVKVTTPEEAAKLPKGTRYITPEGTEHVRGGP